MSRIKQITYLGIGIALYVALSGTMKIPLIAHIQTDRGYIVFGAYCVIFGWKGAIVGTVGCVLESLIFNGMFPPGWALGQIIIGLGCGNVYQIVKDNRKIPKYTIAVIFTIIAVFIGIAGVKTVIECLMFSIPLEVKFPKNFIAFIADTIPMIIGYIIGDKLKGRIL